jgi:hypothetical protein
LGTVARGSAYRPASVTGHKRCADDFYARIQNQEREKNFAMVQRINQREDGAVNPGDAFNPVQGSIPLEKVEKPEDKPTPGTVIGDMSQGAHFLGDLPEDATPTDAVRFAQGEPLSAQEKPPVPLGTAPVSAFYSAPLTDTLPTVDAHEGQVVLTLQHLQSQVTPEDAEDFIEVLKVYASRARRQRGN